MDQFQQFFKMSRSERDGFLTLTIILFLFAISPALYFSLRKTEPESYELVTFPTADKTLQKSVEKTLKNERIDPRGKFDPNTLSDDGWAAWGLSEKQTAVIRRYQKNGGTFKRKEDVRKMYVIDDALYARMEPFIEISSTGSSDRSFSIKSQPEYQSNNYNYDRRDRQSKSLITGKNQSIRIDVNSADTTEWKRLKGIGSILATRIVRFRDALGGFHDVQQLQEVYGLDPMLVNSWENQLNLDIAQIKKLSVNKLSTKELQKHPYIGKKQAQHIVNYRNQHGDFRTINDMRKIVTLNSDFFSKIEPYLDFQ